MHSTFVRIRILRCLSAILEHNVLRYCIEILRDFVRVASRAQVNKQKQGRADVCRYELCVLLVLLRKRGGGGERGKVARDENATERCRLYNQR